MRVHRRRAHGRYGGSERRRRCSGPWCTSAADGDHRDGDQPFQGHVWLLFKGSFGASHAVNRPAASAVGLAGEHERRVVEEINRLSLHLESGDVTQRPPAGHQTPALTRDEEVDLRLVAIRTYSEIYLFVPPSPGTKR